MPFDWCFVLFAVLDGFYRCIVIEEVLECGLTEIFDLSFFIPEINNITSPLNTNQPPLNFSEKKNIGNKWQLKGFLLQTPRKYTLWRKRMSSNAHTMVEENGNGQYGYLALYTFLRRKRTYLDKRVNGTRVNLQRLRVKTCNANIYLVPTLLLQLAG